MQGNDFAAFGGHSRFRLEQWLFSHGLAEGAWSQLTVIVITLALAGLIYLLLFRPWVEGRLQQRREAPEGRGTFLLFVSKRLFLPALTLFCLWIVARLSGHYGSPHKWYDVANVLLLAWVGTRLVMALILLQVKKTISRLAVVFSALFIWIIAALEVGQLLEPLLVLLDKIDVSIGSIRISLLHLIKGGLLLGVFLLLSRAVGAAFSAWIHSKSDISPSGRVLTEKLFRVAFFSLAVVVILGGLGIDLTSLAWFSGAVGLGIGFGLQKVISNLASGFIILADKSIKPGDVIQVGQTYGWINHLGSRYVSVITRDGVEYLIPNEELISGKVINWSYSNNLVRIRVPVAISYEAKVELAMKLMEEAALKVPRVLSLPAPVTRLLAFGDSALNMEVRVWIADPAQGIGNVKSDVLLHIWQQFQEHGIEVPYPQRVLHHKNPPGGQGFPGPDGGSG